MKKTAFLLFAAALACAMAAALTGCKSGPGTRFSEATIGHGFAATNRAGVVISGGQQMNTLLGGDGAFSDWRSVAETAAASGQEFSLTVIGHGASRQPDVKRESTNAKKAQDAFGNFVAKAASGDKAGAAESMGEAMFYGSAYAAEMANPPQADEAGFVGAYAAVGPGANLSGLGVAAELRQTRVESIRAARANYSSTVTYAPQDITTTNGLQTVNAALPVLADAYKAKLAADAAKDSPAAVVGGSPKPGSTPEAETPAPAAPPGDAGTGEPSDSTPAARVAAMYPGMRLGGGNYEEKKMPDGTVVRGKAKPASERSLWKPDSDNSGDLVVVLPHSAMGVIKSMTVNGETVAPDSIGNGWRPHLRFSKPGASYSGAFTIRTSEGDWTGTAPGGKRTEPIPMKKASGPLSVSDLQAGDAAAPGE